MLRRRRGRADRTAPASLSVLTPTARRDLVLVILGRPAGDDFIALVAGCVARPGSEVLVCRAVQLPDALPLNAQLPADEDTALVEGARGALAARGLRVSTEVVHSRDAARSLLELARIRQPRLILVNGVRTARGGLTREAGTLLRDVGGARVVLFEG